MLSSVTKSRTVQQPTGIRRHVTDSLLIRPQKKAGLLVIEAMGYPKRGGLKSSHVEEALILRALFGSANNGGTPIGPLMDVFLHETAHAIFASLQISIFGREEDAAEQFSTYMMLKFDKDEARRLILGSAYQCKGDMASPTITIKQQKFADEHGTPAQRFFNLLCTAYGSDPKLFADVVEKGFLPEDRAVG